MGEQRGRRGEGRCLATGERRGWGTGRGKGCSVVFWEGVLLPGDGRRESGCLATGKGSLLLLGNQKRPCYLETGEEDSSVAK